MRLVLKRADGDCGLAALATVLSISYEDCYVAMSGIDPTYRGKSGVTFGRLIRVAALFGVRMRRRFKPDLDEHEGILMIRWNRPETMTSERHAVVLWNGIIVDTEDGAFMDADEYLADNNATAETLLEIRK